MTRDRQLVDALQGGARARLNAAKKLLVKSKKGSALHRIAGEVFEWFTQCSDEAVTPVLREALLRHALRRKDLDILEPLLTRARLRRPAMKLLAEATFDIGFSIPWIVARHHEAGRDRALAEAVLVAYLRKKKFFSMPREKARAEATRRLQEGGYAWFLPDDLTSHILFKTDIEKLGRFLQPGLGPLAQGLVSSDRSDRSSTASSLARLAEKQVDLSDCVRVMRNVVRDEVKNRFRVRKRVWKRDPDLLERWKKLEAAIHAGRMTRKEAASRMNGEISIREDLSYALTYQYLSQKTGWRAVDRLLAIEDERIGLGVLLALLRRRTPDSGSIPSPQSVRRVVRSLASFHRPVRQKAKKCLAVFGREGTRIYGERKTVESLLAHLKWPEVVWYLERYARSGPEGAGHLEGLLASRRTDERVASLLKICRKRPVTQWCGICEFLPRNKVYETWYLNFRSEFKALGPPKEHGHAGSGANVSAPQRLTCPRCGALYEWEYHWDFVVDDEPTMGPEYEESWHVRRIPMRRKKRDFSE
ncbi:MAG: hypothetical protein QF752_17125 [Planctomycetota bacterium]|nr:hypothetical protein [Planctomycetota bacterium]